MRHVEARLAGSLTVAVAVGAVVVGGLLGLQGASSLWLIGMGLAVLPLLVLIDREALVYVCLAATYVLNWLTLTLGVLPQQATWVLEIAIAILLARSVVDAYRRGSFRIPLPIGLVAAVVLLSAVLGILSGVPIMVTLLGIRTYLRFPLIALCLVIAPLGTGFEGRLWRVLLGVGVLQIVTSLFQLVTVGPGDLASGTFGLGGTGIQALFLTPLAVTCMLHGLVVSRGAGVWRFWLGVALLVPSVIGSAVAVFITVPASLLFGLVVYARRPGKVILGLATASLVFAVLVPYALDYMSSTRIVDPATLLSSPSEVIQYDRSSTATGITMGRIDQFLLAGSLTVGGDLTAGVLGRGPASASRSSLGLQYGGPLLRYAGVQFVVTGLALGLLELGVLGVLVFVGVFVYAVRLSTEVFSGPHGPDTRLIAVFTGLMAFEMLIAGGYSNPWFLPGTAQVFWVCLGLLISRRLQNPESRVDDVDTRAQGRAA